MLFGCALACVGVVVFVCVCVCERQQCIQYQICILTVSLAGGLALLQHLKSSSTGVQSAA